MGFSRRSILSLLSVLLLPLLAGGCWDQVGMAERALVVGIGLDRIPGDQPILLTVQLVNFSAFANSGGALMGKGQSGGKGGGTAATRAVVIATSRGKSLTDAIRGLLGLSARQMTFSHNRMVVFGQEMAKAGIAGVIEEMQRNPQFRPTNWIMVAERTAKEILESRTDLGSIPAQEINKMMLRLAKDAYIPPANRTDLIRQLTSEGGAGLVPVIEEEKPGVNPEARLKIGKTAIIKGDRLVGFLTQEESETLSWMTDEPKGGLVMLAAGAGGTPADVSVEIAEGATRIKPRITGGRLIMEITCSGLGELRGTDGLANTPREAKRLERRIESVLKKRVERVIAAAQRLRADFLGFARLIHADYPERWHRMRLAWEEELPKIASTVQFRITVRRYGSIKDSILAADSEGAD